MIVEFENRSGEIEQAEMEIDEPCPICCGNALPVCGIPTRERIPLQQLRTRLLSCRRRIYLR